MDQDQGKNQDGKDERMDQDYKSDGAKSRPGTGLSLALNSTIISPKFVGAYRIRPPHAFEPGLKG